MLLDVLKSVGMSSQTNWSNVTRFSVSPNITSMTTTTSSTITTAAAAITTKEMKNSFHLSTSHCAEDLKLMCSFK